MLYFFIFSTLLCYYLVQYTYFYQYCMTKKYISILFMLLLYFLLTYLYYKIFSTSPLSYPSIVPDPFNDMNVIFSRFEYYLPTIFDERKIQRGYESLLNRVFSAFDGHTYLDYQILLIEIVVLHTTVYTYELGSVRTTTSMDFWKNLNQSISNKAYSQIKII